MIAFAHMKLHIKKNFACLKALNCLFLKKALLPSLHM